jgi:hypothetical protein
MIAVCSTSTEMRRAWTRSGDRRLTVLYVSMSGPSSQLAILYIALYSITTTPTVHS